MDTSIKILFTVAGEILFLFNLISLIRGLLTLKKSGAVILAEKLTWIRVYALMTFGVLAQIAFFVGLSGPNYYLFSLVSGFSVLYPNVMASECLFAYREKELWFGFKRYEKGAVKAVMDQQRRKNLNVLLEERGGKQFVLRTTPALWEEIKTHL